MFPHFWIPSFVTAARSEDRAGFVRPAPAGKSVYYKVSISDNEGKITWKTNLQPSVLRLLGQKSLIQLVQGGGDEEPVLLRHGAQDGAEVAAYIGLRLFPQRLIVFGGGDIDDSAVLTGAVAAGQLQLLQAVQGLLDQLAPGL